MSKGIAGLLLLGLCCGQLPAAEVMRWQDSRGQWHFGGPEAAAQDAEPVILAPPSRGLDMKLGDAVITDKAYPGKRKTRGRRLEELVVEDRQTDSQAGRQSKKKRLPQKQKESCEQWRERLRKSRLGLRDHEGQAAYERECILNVHW